MFAKKTEKELFTQTIIYNRLQEVAQQKSCSIQLKATSYEVTQAVIHKSVSGKPLIYKAKSSNAPFLNGKLPIHPCLSKNFPCEEEQEMKSFFRKIEEAQSALLFNDFELGTFSIIDTFISLKETFHGHFYHFSEYGQTICAKNDIPLIFKEIFVDGERCFLSQNFIDKFSTVSKNSLRLAYLLKEVCQEELFLLKEKYKLPFIGDGEKIYQIFLRFQDDKFNQLFQQDNEIIAAENSYYPVKILAEYCGWDASQKGLYFPLVADYDILAIDSLMTSKNSDYYAPQRSHIPSNNFNLWLNNYDYSFTKLKELDKLRNHLGIISLFENEIRLAINEILGVPMVRHGCQINNISLLDSRHQDVININY